MLGQMMLERIFIQRYRRKEPLYDIEKARQVGRDVFEVVTHLQTSRDDKDHGAYLYYEDDRLSIRFDTWGSNCSVKVGSAGERQTVFVVSGGTTMKPDIFRAGLWVDYLHEVLLPRAEESKRLVERRKAEEEAERNRRNYGKFDDAALFGDLEEVSA